LPARDRRLRFGVQLRPQRTTWARYAAAIKAVEQLDFDTIWNSDHLLPASGPDDDPRLETLTTLGAMAALTTRARIGALVFGALYRDPGALAKAAVTVDHISGGRLEFALGAAWSEAEFLAYGMPYPSLAERYARLDESLQIVKSLWTQPRTSFHGRYYQIDNAPCEPKPLQLPHPPITVGGVGVGALRIAAKYANASNMCGAPGTLAERVGMLRRFCEEADRDFEEIELSLHSELALAPTHEEAEALAIRVASQYGQDLAGQRDTWLIGTPTELVDQLARYIDIGICHWIIHLDDPFEMTALRLLRDEVAPAFR
jgi:alkanesulfonate monooxygenase SsuD/methylene tetrahydromethanopterin reductase-like flavin-dependent oxidoreductase (luciferase family)